MIRWGSSLASGAWVLRIHYPDGKQSVFSISRGKLQIGSDSHSCGLVISGQGVSPRHCSLTEREGRLLLIDNGSAEGTWLNGRRLSEPAELRAGDRIDVGDHHLRLLASRPRIDAKIVAHRLRHIPILWVRDPAERARDLVDELCARALVWQAAGSPRSGLMSSRELAMLESGLRTLALERSVLEAPLRAWADASERYLRLRGQAVVSAFFALVGAAAIAYASVRQTRGVGEAPPDGTTEVRVVGTSETRVEIESSERSTNQIEHTAIACETLQEIAALYDVKAFDLAEQNGLREADPLHDEQALRVRTTRAPVRRWEERHLVEEGETWSDLAEQYHLPESQVRRCNPDNRGALKPGDEIVVWVPIPEVEDLTSDFKPPEGGVGACELHGSLAGAVQLPELPHYLRRCRMNSYGTTATIEHLVNGLARFRHNTHYSGEVVVGDISRRFGGSYGRHKSHQSGRDVDLWLPVKRKSYLRGCRSCDTNLCRPEPVDVDWRTTWRLIQALNAEGAVEVIFLDYDLQKNLHAAAKKQGASAAELTRMIQWPRKGAPALVQHSDGHVHHMHVRFRCAQ